MPDLAPLLTPDRHELVELVRDLHSQASPWVPSGLGNHLHWGPQPRSTPVCDVHLSAEGRALALASLLSVEEKAQLMSTGGAGGGAGAGVERLGVPGFPTGEGLHGVAADACVADSGHPSTGGAACPTSFPHALALAAGFSRDDWQRVGAAISLEARALHNAGIGKGLPNGINVGLVLFAPDINLFRYTQTPYKFRY